MKRILLEELLQKHRKEPYDVQCRYVRVLLEQGKIKPLKASGLNGKKPALYLAYWLIEEKKDYRFLEEELKYRLHPMICIDYYLEHPIQYEKDRSFVLRLDRYLRENRDMLSYPESVGERSFEIWGREKFLTREQGKTILKRCGLGIEDFYCYQTAEPLAYYSHTRKTPQNLLILENKDTFYSMRKHLLDGNTRILDCGIGTLVYGAGKRILRSFEDFTFCMEPYMTDTANSIYYFGDLDYEGIGIYEHLADSFEGQWDIQLFLPAYLKMLEKAEHVEHLPDMKEKQNRNISGRFLACFSEKQRKRIQEILAQGSYIPQEILNISDF